MRPEFVRMYRLGLWLGVALGLLLLLCGNCAEVW